MPQQPQPEEWTVPGLTHRKKGEYLETVVTKIATFGLVHSSPELEFIEVQIKKGERLTLAPFDQPEDGGIEAYHILSGHLYADAAARPLAVGPGDTLIATQLSETVSFLAAEDCLLMGVTSRPTFHMVSAEMSDLMRMAVAVEEKDGYTGEHCERLQRYSLAIGRVLKLSHARMYRLEIGAYLHDLGKVRVPDSILGKSGPLTPEEWAVMKQHPTWGREFLDGTLLAAAGPILEQHHERLDGSGYPLGLKGSEILLESMIVAVADTYDAITTDRPYRKGATPLEALRELSRFAVSHYPNEVIEAFAKVLQDEGQIP